MKREILLFFLLIVIGLSGCIQQPICGNGICETGETIPRLLTYCPKDCPQLNFHFECSEQKCVEVFGPGTDQCTTDANCATQPQTHTECKDQQCIEIEGIGADQCLSNVDCQPKECSDGTPYGQCSVIQKPQYCDNGALVNNCKKCGCPATLACQENGACETQLVDIFVDSNTYLALSFEINRLKGDIESDFGGVKIYAKDFNGPKEIRDIIKRDYSDYGIKGVILIGNITMIRYGITLSDFFYMDLDEKVDECYVEDMIFKNVYVDRSCLGHYPPAGIYPYTEIWSGRLKPLKEGIEGIEQLRSYLNRDHAYRQGQISYDKKITLLDVILIFDYSYSRDRYFQLFEEALRRSQLYDLNDATIIYDRNSFVLKEEYVKSLGYKNEFTFLGAHGTAASQYFGGPALYSNEVEDLKPKSLIYDIGSCSNGDFFWHPKVYIAGAYLFSGEALIVMANTVDAFSVTDERSLENTGQLRLGIPIGEVYKHKKSDLVSHLFGDPTLRLRTVDLENSPRLEVDSLFVDFGEQPIGSETEISYTIRNKGRTKLIINPPLSTGAKFDGNFVEGYIPFYWRFEGTIDPLSEKDIKLFFRLERDLVKEGTYEGFFLEMPTNDPTKPWITINLRGKAIAPQQ